MLNAHAHGKRLGLQRKTDLLQIPEGIPGRVPHRKDDLITGDHFTAVNFKTGNCPILLQNTGNLGIKTHLTPQGNDPLAQVLHHCQQHIRTHMGLGIKEDILPGAGLYKLLQNPADAGIVHPGIQLAV